MKEVKSQEYQNPKDSNYFEKLCSQTLANFKEMDIFSDRYKLPNMTQEDRNMLNPRTSNEIDTTTKNPSTKKRLGPDEFTAEFYSL